MAKDKQVKKIFVTLGKKVKKAKKLDPADLLEAVKDACDLLNAPNSGERIISGYEAWEEEKGGGNDNNNDNEKGEKEKEDEEWYPDVKLLNKKMGWIVRETKIHAFVSTGRGRPRKIAWKLLVGNDKKGYKELKAKE